jgi:altronate hydrolase
LGRLLKINPLDNVAVAVEAIKKGETADGLTVSDDIGFGHKAALCDIRRGERVIKYGFPIGTAVIDIKKGQLVHSHNLKSAVAEQMEYEYKLKPQKKVERTAAPSFYGYRRSDGGVGIRNEVWIIPLVGCVNSTAEELARRANECFGAKCGGFFAFTHPYGCSQLGDDHENTRRVLAGLCRHPNAAGMLLVGLGCENNTLSGFLPLLGEYDRRRVKALVTQSCADELSEGTRLLGELADYAAKQERAEIPASELIIGFKCGGSDAFSGITANPLCGRLTDIVTGFGGRAILTETPEMFGAETILMERASDRETFLRLAAMINGFKSYFTAHGQAVYENPSPGNKEGGITTLEEKSLGCIQKGGSAAVTDVLDYSERCRKPGLSLLNGPGNDIVSCTNLAAAGAHMILFTTGRGTPLGAPVPTIKISTNTELAERKKNWIDYDAGEILAGKSFEDSAAELLSLTLQTASGKKTRSEQNGSREMAIFKDGVTL